MPLSLARGTVTAVAERHEGLVRLEVDGTPCVAYPRLTGPVALGDDVVVNVQARELDRRIAAFDDEMASNAKEDEAARRLATIPGIGVLNATALTTVALFC